MPSERFDRASIQPAWAAQGFSCEVWIDAPCQVWHDLLHDVDQLVLLIEGESTVELSGKTIRMSAGDQLLIPAHSRHTLRNTGSGVARWLRGFRGEQPLAGESHE